MKVTSTTRTGIAYQRGERNFGAMLLSYHFDGRLCRHARVVYKRSSMSQAAPAITRNPADVVRTTPVSQASNGICYAVAGESSINSFDMERMISAVPTKAAAALKRKAYYFVPLTV